MDPAWDHTENEDKLLLGHTSRMNMDMGQDMYCSDNVSRGGCNDNYEVNVLDTRLDYQNYLLSIIINNIKPFRFILSSNLFYQFSYNLNTMCVKITNIWSFLICFNREIHKSVNIIKCINKLICICKSSIIDCFQQCLNQIKSKIVELHPIFLELRDKFGEIKHLIHDSSKALMCDNDITSLNTKLCEMINRYKSSITEFNKIECNIKSAKSKISELSKLKQQLCKQFEKILLIICITNSSDRVNIVIINGHYLKKKMECLTQNIEKICSEFEKIEDNTNSLKFTIDKFINLYMSKTYLEKFPYFHLILNTDIDEICSLINWFNFWICKICNISNSTCQCKCNCSCIPKRNGNRICLCLCDCSKDSTTNGCCVCICKKDKCGCKCICICVCDKTGGQCCCQSGSHTCKKCLVKLDIGTLLWYTCKILYHLRRILCYISRIENKCCSCDCCEVTRCNQTCCTSCGSCTSTGVGRCCCCSCCVGGCVPAKCCSYCCCKYGTMSYLSKISRMHRIEYLLKQIVTKINQLRTLKNILSPLLIIATKCAKCADNCCNKIQDLIDIISISCRYYYRINYELKDIGSLLEYKVYYRKSNELLNMLTLSLKPLSQQLELINSQILTNINYNIMPNKLLISVYSDYSRFQCYLDLYIILQSSLKLSMVLYINRMVENCECVKCFNLNCNSFKTTDFHKYLNNCCVKKVEDPSKLFIDNDGNHMCLCLVIKYVLYPSLIKSIFYLKHVYYEGLSKTQREFIPNMFNGVHVIEVTKILFIIIDVIYGLSMFMKYRYIYPYANRENNNKFYYFCRDPKDEYYPFLISILLYVSSLIENIWSKDTNNIRVDTEKISIVLSEFKSTHIYTNYYAPLRYKIYSLLLNKDCKNPCKCGTKDKCCCWCVSIVNLIIMCIYLSIQCKLCKAICNKQGNGCDKVKEYFKEMECKCTCQDKQNGLCCLLNLALSGIVGCSEELLKCCKECNGQDGFCKKILEKVKKGLCKLLLLGCCCNDGKGECGEGEVKVKCLMFNNPYSDKSVAVVVLCKCKEDKCCCLNTLVDKLKSAFEKVCSEDCCCDKLKDGCKDLCCGTDCGACVCKNLKEACKEICGKNCNGDGSNCVCKLIKQCLENLCKNCSVSGKQCKCATKGGCCRCAPCKIVAQGVRLLTRACRANVLEPYKRVVMELLSCSKDKPELIRQIIKSINGTTLNKLKLLKNNYITSNSHVSTKNIGVINVETRNWGYDTKYEHDVSTDKGFRRGDQYPYFSHNERAGYHNVRSSRMFKMIISRMLVGGVIVFMFLYLRVSYSINNPFCILYIVK